jgi:hypothetical protein
MRSSVWERSPKAFLDQESTPIQFPPDQSLHHRLQ